MNKNLLSDNDVVQLLRSYVNDSMLVNLKGSPTQPHQNVTKLICPVVLTPPPATISSGCSIESAAQQKCNASSETMEVAVDPCVFLPDEESITIGDDDDTVSAAEAKIETAKLEVSAIEIPAESNVVTRNCSKYICSSCPQQFSTNSELQNHVVTHLISLTSSPSQTSTKSVKGATHSKQSKRKRVEEEKLRSRRKKIVIRINPSPSRRNAREKAKVMPKFSCAICYKSLSSKRNLHFHQETHKESNGKFRCVGEGCKRLFGTLESFVKHRLSHEKPKRRNQNEKWDDRRFFIICRC